jgi:hypothetical protein
MHGATETTLPRGDPYLRYSFSSFHQEVTLKEAPGLFQYYTDRLTESKQINTAAHHHKSVTKMT